MIIGWLPVARRDVGQRSWALQKMSPCRKTAGGNVGESDMDAGGLKKLFLVFDRLSMKVKTLGTEGHFFVCRCFCVFNTDPVVFSQAKVSRAYMCSLAIVMFAQSFMIFVIE